MDRVAQAAQEGERVLISFQAANYDEDVFPNPLEFDAMR
jgi:cytochrome P450